MEPCLLLGRAAGAGGATGAACGRLAGGFLPDSGALCSLGMAPGRPRDDDQKATFAAAIDRVLKACQDAGVIAGIHTGDGTTAAAWVRRGFQWVTVVSEYGLVINGGTRELAAARQAIAAS